MPGAPDAYSVVASELHLSDCMLPESCIGDEPGGGWCNECGGVESDIR